MVVGRAGVIPGAPSANQPQNMSKAKMINTQPILRKLMLRTAPVLAAVALIALGSASAETVRFESSGAGSGSVLIEGTSTLHDWEVKGDAVHGFLVLNGSGIADATVDPKQRLLDGTPKARVEIPVDTLTSDNRGMDRRMLSALSASEHPTIDFALDSVRALEDGDRGEAEAIGELTISGVTRTVAFPVTIRRNDDALEITGVAELVMSDFEIDPPRAMLGAIRTGDEITVRVTWEPTFAPGTD